MKENSCIPCVSAKHIKSNDTAQTVTVTGVKASSSRRTPAGERSPSMAMCRVPGDLERPVYLIKNEAPGNKARTQPSPPHQCLSFMNYAAVRLDCVSNSTGRVSGVETWPVPLQILRCADGQRKARWATHSSATNLGKASHNYL